MVTAAAWFCFRNGWILYYGDAQAHLNISRGLIDSRTPGYDQLGTVWLPVLHVICLPFVRNDWFWSTGLAGTIPVALCFVIAGSCFYLAAQDLYQDALPAAVALACWALNPNVLYLATIPMTEIVFMAGLFTALLASLRFRTTLRPCWFLLAVLASWLLSLTRYDGWFLIPFLAAWLAASADRKRLLVFILFGSAASLAPLYWAAHNWWETGNAFDFYNGPYSAAAIQGGHSYPGLHNWTLAAHYYGKASELCAGPALLFLGVIGAVAAYRYRVLQPVLFLALTPCFYIWSMHSSGGSPIYIPDLWPHSYYNSRYGLAAVPLCAWAAGAIVLFLPQRLRKFALAIPLIAIAPWLLHPTKESWICWKESQVNSVDRRAWTESAAAFLKANYRPGQAILTSAGDVTGVYCRAQIHLSETVNIGNGPLWTETITRPDLFRPALWTIYQAGDGLSKALDKASPPPAKPILIIESSRYSPALLILKRENSHP